MKTKTKTTKTETVAERTATPLRVPRAWTIREAVVQYRDRAAEKFAEYAEKFADAVRVNPTTAVVYNAESTVLAQWEFDSWERIAKYLDSDRRVEDNRTIREAVVYVCGEFRDYVEMAVGGGQSTSAYANGTEATRLRALVRVMRDADGILARYVD